MNTAHNNDPLIYGTGIIGTIAGWTLQGGLSLLATVCTIIVVGPKALEQVTVWYVKAKLWLERRRKSGNE